MRNLLPLVAVCLAEAQTKLPAGMFPVKPFQPATAIGRGGELRLSQGRFFSYALPDNWHVGEQGQFAVTLLSPDNQAFTVMVGNAGMPVNYPLDRFVYEKISALRPQSIHVSGARQVAPRPGFHHAVEFDVNYVGQRGLPGRGIAKCNVMPSYDTALIVMTGAFSTEAQWSAYSRWLPLTAEQISATDGAAFGRRGVMAQNLRLSKEYGEAARAYREWSQKNWQGVTDQRNASNERVNSGRRESLGSSKAYVNPYDASGSVELPLTYQYYWVNRQGIYAGTNDPSINPNDGSTSEWKRMPLQRP